MAFQFAGSWGPEAITNVVTLAGTSVLQVLTGVGVAVKDSTNTNLVTLYTSRTKAATVTNPTAADAFGNLHIFADPGTYTVTVTIGNTPQTPFTIQVPVDSAEPITPALVGASKFEIAGSTTVLPVPAAVGATFLTIEKWNSD